ncbi:MAG: VWA domain-containing protein [Bacteroidales bacterium]|jgi:Ca-activated chloride channel family protein|nr:VWA domain-containing protein [Bacteroidales bacterium]
MFKFGHPEYLILLIVIPVLALLYILSVIYKKRALKKFGDLEIIEQLMPYLSKNRPLIKFIFLAVSFAAVIVALADPQFGSKVEIVKKKGAEIIIALDVSNSMLAEDLQPNRLERAKQAISKLIDKLENDRFGLIIFAGDSYIQVPLTTDYAASKMFLSSINTGIVTKQGTAIGSAIDLAMNSFTPETEMDKALIVITDGENHEDDAIAAAKLAKEKGITIHTIGMGSPEGAPIPIREGYGQTLFLKDRDGNVVISKLDQVALQQIASETEGIFIRANNSDIGLNKLLEQINKMQKQEVETKIYTEFEHRYQYLLGIAILLLIIELLIAERKSKRFSGFNIFKINA